MKKRYMAAMGAYAVLALLTTLTTSGTIRIATLIFLAGLALKTTIAYKAGWGRDN